MKNSTLLSRLPWPPAFTPAILILFVILSSHAVYAQDQADHMDRRNTIKVDITSYWLYRNALVFAYERITKPNQSFAITAGYQQFPPLGTLSDSVNITRELKASGLKIGGEYRFYLQKENKYGAPHGVYIGPYVSFHNYSNERSIEVDNAGTQETATLSTDLNILNIGVQLGYQFVLNNRWTLDIVFVGPSVSNYNYSANLSGNYTFDPDTITNEVILALIDRFPGFSDLINEGEFKDSGKLNTWAYGYRYQFQIGYHFGRKK